MTAILALLKDRRRSQRGSVLSGVLIMTAFIAIISGALMTELSTNFLLSHTMLNRVATEATDNSAMEQALSQLQTTQLNAPCPALPTTSVNNLSASSTYVSCWPAIREAQKYTSFGSSSSAFNLDGVHVQANGFNEYVVGNAGGLVFDYRFGTTTPRWTLALNGTLTSPPVVIANPGSTTRLIDLFPMRGAACQSGTSCVDVWSDSGTALSHACTIASGSGSMFARAGASPGFAGFVYYAVGTALGVSDLSGSDCDPVASGTIPGNQPVVAGPVAFRCTGCSRTSDQVYAVVSDSVSSRLVWAAFNGANNLSSVSSLSLPWPNAVGVAASGSSLPASLAITFAGGGVALVQLSSNGAPTLLTSSTPAGISAAPYWCAAACGGLFGVGAQNGVLYLFDSSRNLIATHSTGSPINTSPSADAAGNWFVGTDDGYVHELQLQGGQGFPEVESYGRMTRFGSSAQLGACGTGICIYLGAQDGTLYLVPLDARKAVISACITTSPPTCSGVNPRLWASVEVGAVGSPQTVHVEGWSYYSG